MSFSSEVKKESAQVLSAARHCQIAERAAVIALTGRIEITEKGEHILWVHTENPYVADKFFKLVDKVSGKKCEVSTRLSANRKTMTYTVVLTDNEACVWILKALKYMGTDGELEDSFPLAADSVVQLSCCKRAFIRGAFLASGSLGDPKKAYHFEIVTDTKERALVLAEIMESLNIKARITQRKNHFIVYLKEGDEIVDILAVIEAPVALMNLENIRVMKDVRNKVNRKVNCETANIEKTAKASARQLADIEYIRDTKGLEWLPDGLHDVAVTRLENPDLPLKELGAKLMTPLGKSGVNHRLARISKLAKDLRGKE